MGEKNGTVVWNEDFWSKNQTKAIQGICAIVIILHHMSQKTCAQWVPSEHIMHGLEPFLSLGYIMVGVFFFCSGYGLYKSAASRENYLEGFIGRHFRPIILLFLITNAVYYLVGGVFSGYNWYIYAILYLYTAFYISFRCFRKKAAAVTVMAASVALYIAVCELAFVGTWCYNTVGVFLIGMLFAGFFDEIVKFFKRFYWICLAGITVLLVISFIGADALSNMLVQAETMSGYNLARCTSVAVQFLASGAFSVFLFLLNLKLRIRSRIAEFLGSLSLELYLIHVLYVEMFGYCFGNAGNKAICHIAGLWLYVPAVLALSLISAYLLSLLKKGAEHLYVSSGDFFAIVRRDCRKVLIGILIAFGGLTVLLAVSSAVNRPKLKAAALEYRNENISFVHSEGTDIALYRVGNGERCVLIFPELHDPCPTLMLKGVADELAKEYSVVLIDLPGTGFSGEHTSERTIDNICRELHGVAGEQGLENYIVLAVEDGCLLAQYYVNQYPHEVSAVLALDAENAGLGRAMLQAEGMSVPEYARMTVRDSSVRYLYSRILDYSGYKTFLWPVYQDMFMNTVGWTNYDVAELLFFSKNESRAIRNESNHELENYLFTEKLMYPADVTVVDFLSEGRRNSFKKRGIAAEEYLDRICENGGKHSVIAVQDCRYSILNDSGIFRTNIPGN